MRQFFALHRWAGQNVQRDALEIQEALFKAHFKEFYNVIVTKALVLKRLIFCQQVDMQSSMD